VNLAHGELIVLAGFALWSLPASAASIPVFFAAVMVALPIVVTGFVLTVWCCLNRTLGVTPVAAALHLGLSIIIQNGFCRYSLPKASV